jgi:hypothetical protein
VPSVAFSEMPGTIALFARLHRDALIAALDREIATEADDDAALSHRHLLIGTDTGGEFSPDNCRWQVGRWYRRRRSTARTR